MSVENVSYEMQNGTFPLPPTSGDAIKVVNAQDPTYGSVALLVYAGRAISLAATGTGYAEGCLGIDTSGASGTNGDASVVYNSGTSASPTWSLVT